MFQFDRRRVIVSLSLASLLAKSLCEELLFRSSAGMMGAASSSGLTRLICRILSSPVTWWSLLILALYLMERFDLGVHSLAWRRKRKLSSTLQYMNGSCNHHSADGGPTSENGIHRTGVPTVFHKYIESQVMPTFRGQCPVGGGGDFAVLVLTQLESLFWDITSLGFRQITFNCKKPLVDSNLITYPERYRYENYVVARSSETEHPEALIARQVPALLEAFRRAERCYIRNPIPKHALVYSSSLPCRQCSEELVKCLSGVCRERTVLAYSRRGTSDSRAAEESLQCLTNAGFTVVKIDPQ